MCFPRLKGILPGSQNILSKKQTVDQVSKEQYILEKSLNIFIHLVEEVPQNMFCIPSDKENIIMEMPQKIRI